MIEFNEVHDCLKRLHDGNCIYLSGNGAGNIVRHNVTYNHPEGSMIRTDDDSHGATVQGNLMFGTTGRWGIASAFHQLLSRPPDATEQKILVQLFDEQLAHFRTYPKSAAARGSNGAR